MKYLNATLVIPDVLLEELQNYIQGGYLYIPVKKEQRKGWGENSGYRKEIDLRNKKILQAYLEGVSIEEIADLFCLSVYTIRKIIYQK